MTKKFCAKIFSYFQFDISALCGLRNTLIVAGMQLRYLKARTLGCYFYSVFVPQALSTSVSCHSFLPHVHKIIVDPLQGSKYVVLLKIQV